MRRKGLCWLLAVLLFCTLAVPIHADSGPKPSVQITIYGLGDEPCWGTLLSEKESTGPASVWEGEEPDEWRRAMPGWEVFVRYEDPDGYYYLQESWDVGETGELAWTYYPPYRFKLLLYFPEREVFLSSGILERYAFHSTFTARITDGTLEVDPLGVGGATISVERDTRLGPELLGFFLRLLLTLGVEMFLALAFGYREKVPLLLILLVNGVTQVGLNVALNLVGYFSGPLATLLLYFLLELLIFVVEAVLYAMLLPKHTRRRPTGPVRAALYAFSANLLSLLAGVALMLLLPGMF